MSASIPNTPIPNYFSVGSKWPTGPYILSAMVFKVNAPLTLEVNVNAPLDWWSVEKCKLYFLVIVEFSDILMVKEEMTT